jgi:hypothetical protein
VDLPLWEFLKSTFIFLLDLPVVLIAASTQVSIREFDVPTPKFRPHDPAVSPESFVLNGNHEMYANGGGYFDVLIPNLDLRTPIGETLDKDKFFSAYKQVLANHD